MIEYHHEVLTHELIRLSCIVYGLSVIEDPTLVDSRVSKDTVVVGQKAEPSAKADDIPAPDLDNESLLHSAEVSSCCFRMNFYTTNYSQRCIFCVAGKVDQRRQRW